MVSAELKLISTKFDSCKSVADVLRKIARAIDHKEIKEPEYAVLVLGGGDFGTPSPFGIGNIEETFAAGVLETAKLTLLHAYLRERGEI
jgi:isopentenyl phosphate kinase